MDKKGTASAILDSYKSKSKDDEMPEVEEAEGDDGEAAAAAGEELARAFGLPASKGKSLMAALKEAMEYCH